MKILSKESEEVVVRTKRRVTGVECDVCKRVIEPTSYREDSSRYFEVTTGHNDWGNDSCESIEHFDICPTCIGEFVTKYAQEADGSEYLDLKTTHCYKSDYEYE